MTSISTSHMPLSRCSNRFGCPALLPAKPFCATTPVKLSTIPGMTGRYSTPTGMAGKGREGVSEPDRTHSAESKANNVERDNCYEKNNDANTDSERTGIVCMYRGMTNPDLWVSEEPSGGCDAGSTASSHGLPPVFAMRRVRSAHSTVRVSTAEMHSHAGQVETAGSGMGDPRSSLVGADTAVDPPGTATASATHTHTSSSSGSSVSSSSVSDWSVTALSSAWEERYGSDTYIICIDTSSSSGALGWSVRNVLALLAAHVPAAGEADSGPLNPDPHVVQSPVSVAGFPPSISPPAPASSSAAPFASVTGTGTSAEVGVGVGVGAGAHTSGVSMSNLIVLRGSAAKNLYSCAGREKVVAFLRGLSDEELGERREGE